MRNRPTHTEEPGDPERVGRSQTARETGPTWVYSYALLLRIPRPFLEAVFSSQTLGCLRSNSKGPEGSSPPASAPLGSCLEEEVPGEEVRPIPALPLCVGPAPAPWVLLGLHNPPWSWSCSLQAPLGLLLCQVSGATSTPVPTSPALPSLARPRLPCLSLLTFWRSPWSPIFRGLLCSSPQAVGPGLLILRRSRSSLCEQRVLDSCLT